MERGLLGVGAACLGYWFIVSAAAQADSRYQRWRLDEMTAAHAGARVEQQSSGRAPDDRPTLPGDAVAAHPARADVPPAVPGQTLLGRIRIPRVGLDAIVLEGVGNGTLRVAAGHFPESAPLGSAHGNTALAGHRDSTFRDLRDVKKGDEILVITPRGRSAYRVSWTKVVDPTDVWVVGPSTKGELTLVTCYPFTYIGHAPHRFVVRARREKNLGREPASGAEPAVLATGRTP